MLEYLRELYAHQAWADAELWRAIEAHPESFSDKTLRDRLHHTHMVQWGFLWIVGPRSSEFAFSKVEDFATIDALKSYGARHHAEAEQLLKGITDTRLADLVGVPWFKGHDLEISVAHALTQAALHSVQHRAQNATRLRELGGKAPMLDFIIWLLNGRPAARWD
jgi:uncharacterized damage-inducible protein DinB